MKINLQELMNKLNVNAAQFAEEIGVQRSSISHFLSGRNNPSLDVLRKILMAYPQINAQWLISGEGNMMKSDFSTSNIDEQEASSAENNLFSSVEDEDIVPYEKINQLHIEENPIKTEEALSFKSDGNEKRQTSSAVEKVLIFYQNGTFKEYLPQTE